MYFWKYVFHVLPNLDFIIARNNQNGKKLCLNFQVSLEDGKLVEADLIVLGIGVVPSTKFIDSPSIKKTDFGYIPVNKVRLKFKKYVISE